MPRILLIDDNAELLRSTSAVLRALKHDVVTAQNGAEALKRTDLATFQLVITDILMPEKEGFETIMTLRRQHPTLKIIAVSGGGYIDARQYLESASMLGAHLTLEKPFSGLDLIVAIEKVLGGQPEGS
jgi:CheY-like chemotaxis protein